jgi:putative sterol carrier protein
LTAPWLSAAWFEAAATEVVGVSGPPTCTGSVVVEVTGGVGGDAAAHAVFAEGHLVEAGAGSVPSPEVTLTVTDVDARAVLSGDLDPSVAFMQGRMKVAGAMAPFLDLLALTGTDDLQARRARIAELTIF